METKVKVKLWNYLYEREVREGRIVPVEAEALVDTGARRAVIPGRIALDLGLLPAGTVRVRYADGRTATRELASGLRIEVEGRADVFTVVVEPRARRMLLGHLVLEAMDFTIDVPTGRLVGRHGKNPLEYEYAEGA